MGSPLADTILKRHTAWQLNISISIKGHIGVKSDTTFNFSVPFKRHRTWRTVVGLALGLLLVMGNASAGSILFIGNSFTFGWGSAVRFYRADTVTDLNNQGIGGVPALFKSFTTQAGLDYEVFLETQPASGFDWHIENKLGAIGQRPWDIVILQSQSVLDPKKPGDATVLISTTRQLAEFLRERNPAVELRLTATWARADQIYTPKGAWYGKTLEDMTRDLRAGYDQASAGTSGIKSVVPIGEAWLRAIQTGVADANPYDGIDAGKINLWSYDSHHASVYGYYLQSLVLFGSITGRDPRSLGTNECSGFELGLSPAQVDALQQVAFDQLAASDGVKALPLKLSKPVRSTQCKRSR
jgi:hypothetical protein